MHFSIDEETARELESRARVSGTSISRYLAQLVKTHMPDSWPEGYLDDIVGSCARHPLEVPTDLELDDVSL